MRVNQLIEELLKFPQDALVAVLDDDDVTMQHVQYSELVKVVCETDSCAMVPASRSEKHFLHVVLLK